MSIQAMLLRKAGKRAFLQNASVTSTQAGAPATAALKFANPNVEGSTDGVSYSAEFQWLLGGNPSDFDVRYTHVSGTVGTGTYGTWLNLGSTEAVNSITRLTVGAITSEYTVELSLAGAGVAIHSATFDLLAERL